jgi:coenzyme F420-0:L-glutamate ligase / coenzyme F420-1:gamma-L-glutamate ligase
VAPGLTDVAIGVSGIQAIVDLRGTEDSRGRELQVTEVCVADELAGHGRPGDGQGHRHRRRRGAGRRPRLVRRRQHPREVVRHPSEDLFR